MENYERACRSVCLFFAGLNDLVLEPLRKLFFSSQVYVKVSQYLFFFSFGKMLTGGNNLCTFYSLERFSLDCRKTKTKVNTLANQRA